MISNHTTRCLFWTCSVLHAVIVRFVNIRVFVVVLVLRLEPSLLKRLFRRVVDFGAPGTPAGQDSRGVDLVELVLGNKHVKTKCEGNKNANEHLLPYPRLPLLLLRPRLHPHHPLLLLRGLLFLSLCPCRG